MAMGELKHLCKTMCHGTNNINVIKYSVSLCWSVPNREKKIEDLKKGKVTDYQSNCRPNNTLTIRCSHCGNS